MYCSKCGIEFNSDVNFCPECGYMNRSGGVRKGMDETIELINNSDYKLRKSIKVLNWVLIPGILGLKILDGILLIVGIALSFIMGPLEVITNIIGLVLGFMVFIGWWKGNIDAFTGFLGLIIISIIYLIIVFIPNAIGKVRNKINEWSEFRF